MSATKKIPEIALRKATVTKTVYEATVSVFIREDIYVKVNRVSNETFTASNGFQIKCANHFSNELTSTVLKLDHAGKGKIYRFDERTVDVDALKQALNELAQFNEITFEGWETYGPTVAPEEVKESQPRTACKIEGESKTIEETELKLFLRTDVYRWVYAKSKEQFKASNGFKIKCDPNCGIGYNRGSDALYLDRTCDGKQIDLKVYSQPGQFENLQSEIPRLQVALAELKEAFLKESPAPSSDELSFTDWAVL